MNSATVWYQSGLSWLLSLRSPTLGEDPADPDTLIQARRMKPSVIVDGVTAEIEPAEDADGESNSLCLPNTCLCNKGSLAEVGRSNVISTSNSSSVLAGHP
jgi:hypothetical protein